MTALNELLQSMVPEEHRGQPGKMREVALALAQRDPARRADYLLWAVLASLAMGEAREAMRLLDTVPAGADVGVARRIRACRSWAQRLDGNWYPGNTGGEVSPDWLQGLIVIERVEPGDAITMLVESCAAFGPCALLTARTLVLDAARNTPAVAEQMIQHGIQSLDNFVAVARQAQADAAALWAFAARADLQWRGGFRDAARATLETVRQICHQRGDAIGVANGWMIEGDRWATPWSSPEALGFVLSGGIAKAAPPPPDDRQALHAYLQAAEALVHSDAPWASAALELRLAFLAGRAGDVKAQREHLAKCQQAYRQVGDVAGLLLATVHGWFADIAAGDLTAMRRIAPLEWAERHGPVAEIATWAESRGSLTWCTGLGRLLQRGGELWAATREFERAEIAYRLAAHLVPLNGAIAAWTLQEALAGIDLQRGLTTRGLVRHLVTLNSLPPPCDPKQDGVAWLRDIELTTGLLTVPSGVSGATEIGIRIIERGEQRLKALLDVAGIVQPTGMIPPSDPQQALAEASAAHETELKSMLAGAPKPGSAEQILLTAAAEATRQSLLRAQPLLALLRARQAERGGWDVRAEQWYRTARQYAAKAGAENRWLEILILHVWGKRAEAQAALKTALQERRMDTGTLTALAIRVRAYEAAEALLQTLPPDGGKDPLEWRGLADRAEVASERGQAAAASALVTRALGIFEEMVNRFPRDADRVAASDDVSAAALYLLASRIHLRLAQERSRDTEAGAAQRALAFGVADRHRMLTLPREMQRSAAASADSLRRWQQAATDHATAYQRLLAALTLGAGKVPALTQALGRAERILADVEATLTPEEQAAVAATRRLVAFTAEKLQRLLPAEACLLEYQLVGRDYVMYAVTATEIVVQEGRLERGSFEGMTSRFVRACANGALSLEAEELSAILLNPFSATLRGKERVIVVPSGALNAVPFHVLPFAGKPLGETHVVSYLPAASLLAQAAVDQPLAGGSTLVVGDPAFDPAAHPSLQRLAGAAVEAKAVAAIHGTKPYLAGEATEASLRPLLSHRALLHFAAHGRLDDIAPNTSSIVLAGDDELTVSDLIGLDIGADLAILSACDTGRGTTTMGGDLVGLVRGLLASGVRRCVVSLWPVDDVAACVTMAMFHRHLKRGTAPAVALAQAQREIRTLSGSEIADRYRALGGTLAARDRSLRRKGSRTLRLPAFSEVDAEDEIPLAAKDGRSTNIWAPFVLIGA